MLQKFTLDDYKSGLYEAFIEVDGETVAVASITPILEAVFRKLAVVTVEGAAFFFSESGVGLGEATTYFLKLKRKPRIGWVNVWKNENPFETLHATTHTTLEQAIAERRTSVTGNTKTLLQRFSFEY